MFARWYGAFHGTGAKVAATVSLVLVLVGAALGLLTGLALLLVPQSDATQQAVGLVVVALCSESVWAVFWGVGRLNEPPRLGAMIAGFGCGVVVLIVLGAPLAGAALAALLFPTAWVMARMHRGVNGS